MRVRMVIAYDGAAFHGFAANPGVVTVAGTLQAALERVLRTPVTLTGAGRTDAGVHALGQVVHFDAPADRVDPARLRGAVNGLCRPSIVCRSAEVADPGFDARFSARWRRYRYRILNRPDPDPFLAATSWHVPRPLDLAALELATYPLIGEHDFTTFCRKVRGADPAEPPSMVRKVLDAGWEPAADGLLNFEIRANAFCHTMVRSIVGTLVDVGLGRRHAGDILALLRARDRRGVGPVAPPHGLFLVEVGY